MMQSLSSPQDIYEEDCSDGQRTLDPAWLPRIVESSCLAPRSQWIAKESSIKHIWMCQLRPFEVSFVIKISCLEHCYYS